MHKTSNATNKNIKTKIKYRHSVNCECYQNILELLFGIQMNIEKLNESTQ